MSGDTVVIGANGESSNARGVNGNQSDNSTPYSGAAYVFQRTGTNWTQQAYLKASNAAAEDNFGQAVAVSGDTVVVGATTEASNATGVNGNQNNNSAYQAGAAYVFVRNGTNWSQKAYLKASNTGQEDWFGGAVAMAGDTIVVGAVQEASNAAGVNGNQGNNSAFASGAAYIFTAPAMVPPELRLAVARNGDFLQLTATGQTNTQWRLESRDTLTGTNPWQFLTNIILGPHGGLGAGPTPVVVQQPLDATNRFYRGAWVP